ncbi:hypothetical protein MKX03_013289 [Papaver bracteatum]|nr:hypothetical protein MKX03_013289 [Papaver bracteatum]
MERLIERSNLFLAHCRNKLSFKDSRLDDLDKEFTSFHRSYLHIAALSGDIKFAKQIVSSSLASKLDLNGFTPLHLASAQTSLQMVKLLLDVYPGACMVQDNEGRTPLHIAAMKNRLEIMKLLVEKEPNALHTKNNQNSDTILHFCVKNNTNFKTLKLLVNKLSDSQLHPDHVSINSINNYGTILHLATATKNMKIVKYLLLNVKTDINVLNNEGQKALDVLSQAERNDLVFGCDDYHVDKQQSKALSKNGEHDGRKDRLNTVMVIATLIAGIAFQAAINPPGGLWQEDSKIDPGTDPVLFAYYLDHMFGMFGSQISGGLDMNIDHYLNNPSVNNNFSRIGDKERESYVKIKGFLRNISHIYAGNYEFADMASKGLILEDFKFTDLISHYKNSTGGFFPYLIRYAGYPVLAYTYPVYYVIFMVTIGVALFVSLAIIGLVICGYVTETSVTQVRILVVSVCMSIGCISTGYLTVLTAMMPDFYNIFNGYSAIFGLFVFFGVSCFIAALWFFTWITWEVVKLRKRSRKARNHLRVNNYLKALFLCMDAKAVGKMTLFIFFYCVFRLTGWIYYDSWSHISRFLY